MDQPWRIELFGWLRATRGDQVVSRFRTQRAGALLAYLAFHRDRSHPREALVELLWPESEPTAGRISLRTELVSLRRQLEPPGVPLGAVLLGTRTTVQLNPAACETDAAQFESALSGARRSANPAERIQHLTDAAELYRGELLPGCFADWVLPERQRLAEAFLSALRELVDLSEEIGDRSAALWWARRAVAVDPLLDECHHRLIRLLLASGQVEAARHQFEQGEALLLRELGTGLSSEIRGLIRDRAPGKDRPPGALSGKRGSGPFGIANTGEELVANAAPAAQLATEPPPPTNHLPLRFTRFFGREREIEQLDQLLREAETKMVTLTGPGGTGKTRLALKVAERSRAAYPGGVWFVSLQDLTDPTAIPDQILRVLRLPRSPQSDSLTQVASFLSRARSLLVLDNYEHLVDGGAEIVHRLLERVDHLTVLVTSRQRLRLEGERAIPVAPLPVPGIQDRARRSRELLIQYPSVQLFVDRAQGVRPDFQLTGHNAGAVAALCECLEGLPLAIELAATRSGVLTPQQMLARLKQRFELFELLVSRQHSPDPRHRSLRATLDWSYQLLAPELQRFFVRLSVFHGGWTVEAAEAVCEEPRALEYLEELRECSLIGAVERGVAVGEWEIAPRPGEGDSAGAAGVMQFHLLATLREYGWERLAESKERDLIRRRHAEYFTRMAAEAESHLFTPIQWRWMDRLEAEHDNLRAALAWWLTAGDGVEAGLKLAVSLWRFWHGRGYLDEGRRHLLAALTRDGGAAQTRAEALRAAGLLALSAGDAAAARPSLEESLVIWRERGDGKQIALLALELSGAARLQGDDASMRVFLEEGLALFRELEAPMGIANCLRDLGELTQRQGDYPSARALYQEGLAVSQAAGNQWDEGLCLHALGDLAHLQGEAGQGWALHEQAVRVFRQNGEQPGIALSLGWMAHFVRQQGEHAMASKLQREALAIWIKIGRRQEIAECLEMLAADALALGQPPESARLSARLLGATEALRQAMGDLRIAAAPEQYDRTVAAVRTVLSESAFAAAWTAGRALPLEQMVAEALQEMPVGCNDAPLRG